MQQPLMFFFAFLAVLAMIGAAAWLVRRFAGNRLGTHTKSGRMPRLAVIDAAAVDGRRRLVLVRRDNVEHLLMIGGPSDIVIETSIVRANPAREASRPGPSVEPRLGPADWEADGAQEAPEPVLPDLPPRPARPSFADEPRRPGPAPMPPRRTSEFPPSDPFAGLVPEPMVRPELPPVGRPEPRAEARPEPRIEPAPRPRPDPAMPRPPRPELPKATVCLAGAACAAAAQHACSRCSSGRSRVFVRCRTVGRRPESRRDGQQARSGAAPPTGRQARSRRSRAGPSGPAATRAAS
jgi:flagellar protein FliO/FliZ